MMFDQLSKPLLGGPASKNAIQMVWGALLCKIGVDTGILIDVQSSRTSYMTGATGLIIKVIKMTESELVSDRAGAIFRRR